MILLGGCYGYYPAVAPTPVGRDVQVTLSDSGSFALARQIGPSTEAIDGRLASDSGGSIVLSVTGVRRRDGSEIDWRGERWRNADSLVDEPCCSLARSRSASSEPGRRWEAPVSVSSATASRTRAERSKALSES